MMKDEFVTDVLIRRFLLGEVDAEERQRIESLFISDPTTKEKILIAEDDLIEDYLETSLPASDTEKFLAQYGQTPEQLQRLRIRKSIKEYGVAKARQKKTPRVENPKWRIVLSGLRPQNPVVFLPFAATLTIALIVAGVWLVGLNNKRTQESSQRLAMERELAELNAPSSPRQATSTIILPPVSFRSVAPQTEITPNDNRVVELQLLWTQTERYPSYRATIRRVGHTEYFTIPNLHVENNGAGTAVRVKLPRDFLTRGLYQISLSGIPGDGAPGPGEEYNFTVGG